MGVPTTDRGAVQQVVRALVKAGHTLVAVNNGEEEIPVSTEREAVEEVMAVDEAALYVRIKDGVEGGLSHVLFVLGNEPEECPADWGLSLSPVMDPLTEGWWSE